MSRAIEWQGTYPDEDGIVADILARVRADPEMVKMWLDPDSWFTDPLFADNLSGRVIDRVKAALAEDQNGTENRNKQ
jgi:hypothetical protein